MIIWDYHILKGTSKMMKRRKFLIFGSLMGMSPYMQAKEKRIFEQEFKKVEATIAAVQEHMFPPQSKLPSAKEMGVIVFLYDTISHKSYDRDIRAFVLEGAQEFIRREKGHFLMMTHEEKEKALRSYEKTRYGSSWLERIMTLTMEGMFSDPVYGANRAELGWKSIDSYGGYPRAKGRYLENV